MKRVFFPNLDALRFFAFLSVFLYHSFETKSEAIKAHAGYQWTDWLFRNGYLGVNFFFVLSGFLITYLLLDERAVTGRIGVGGFYLRRFLRIWPLYFLMVAFGFIGFPYFKSLFGAVPNETADPRYYVFFISNFDVIRSGMPDSSVLGVLWSLAIEEQFYLFWPLFLTVVSGRFYPAAFAALVGGTLVYRSHHLGNPHVIDYSTFSVTSDMVVGAYTAYLAKNGSRVIEWIRNARRSVILGIYFAGVGLIVGPLNLLESIPAFQVAERLALSLFFAFVIVEQNESRNSFFKFGRIRIFSELGKVSYGLYCLHFMGILVVLTVNRKLGFNREWWQVVFLETALALGLTVALSFLSYRFFEGPFLRLKEKFSYGQSRRAVKEAVKA